MYQKAKEALTFEGTCRKRLLEKGLRPGDELMVRNYGGSQRRIRLNRTHYEFHAAHSRLTSGESVPLSGLKRQPLSFSLKLARDPLAPTKDEQARYLLCSNTAQPFCLNQQFSLMSFLERGDHFDLGHNPIVANQIDKSERSPVGIDLGLIESDLLITLQGETGVGKTHLARRIHELSGRRGSFVHLNLSSFNNQLLESELFGHVKGAFTGALFDKKGAFAEAQGGTLFLDEIDSLSLELQTKLLLFFDTKTYRRVGGGMRSTDARLIVASGRSLEVLLKQQKLRRDFYHRLKAGHFVTLPSLRDKTQLIRSFCENWALQNQTSLSEELLYYYGGLSWPGNYRQLKAHLEKKLIMSRGRRLHLDAWDQALSSDESWEDLFEHKEHARWSSLKELKRYYTLKAYESFQGNIGLVAKNLKVSTNTIRTILNEGVA